MPNYFHFLRIMVNAASSCPVPSHSSSFVMPSLWRSLLFKNVCTLESRALVRRQVSESYIEVLIFEYPQLCLEGDGSCFPDSCETHVNPWCVFLICCHTYYPAKGKLSCLFFGCLHTQRRGCHLYPDSYFLGFPQLILSPTLAHALCSGTIFTWMYRSLWLWKYKSIVGETQVFKPQSVRVHCIAALQFHKLVWKPSQGPPRKVWAKAHTLVLLQFLLETVLSGIHRGSSDTQNPLYVHPNNVLALRDAARVATSPLDFLKIIKAR